MIRLDSFISVIQIILNSCEVRINTRIYNCQDLDFQCRGLFFVFRLWFCFSQNLETWFVRSRQRYCMINHCESHIQGQIIFWGLRLLKLWGLLQMEPPSVWKSYPFINSNYENCTQTYIIQLLVTHSYMKWIWKEMRIYNCQDLDFQCCGLFFVFRLWFCFSQNLETWFVRSLSFFNWQEYYTLWLELLLFKWTYKVVSCSFTPRN
jgi:hypothetical protein